MRLYCDFTMDGLAQNVTQVTIFEMLLIINATFVGVAIIDYALLQTLTKSYSLRLRALRDEALQSTCQGGDLIS
ncbi:hypothetical protein CF392_05305 [Tamilnaduibacter salinus]|uniref:Uncharacterized protein n=1 Tax=Tamilnaduibacter salinus TaxID=1484056 RepID=A0A2A2I5R5_9GAMM|nr:hypothetical protein CF392_05305 [Tamilnaduibacter salinus]